MKLRLGEEGRVVNGKKLTFEIGDIVRADQKVAAMKREEEAKKLAQESTPPIFSNILQVPIKFFKKYKIPIQNIRKF
jgi:hypothetical protein